MTTAGLEALREELARLEQEPGEKSAPWRSELEERIASAVVPPAPKDRAEIRFGARVHLSGQGNDDRTIRIVGVDEANPAAGRVAFVAPIARSLLGRRIGDMVTVRTPAGEEEFQVLEVDYDA